MKQILICIGLKIVEIGIFIFIPFYIGKLATIIVDRFNLQVYLDRYSSRFECWIYGVMFLLLTPLILAVIGVLVIAIIVALTYFFTFNWNLAGSF